MFKKAVMNTAVTGARAKVVNCGAGNLPQDVQLRIELYDVAESTLKVKLQDAGWRERGGERMWEASVLMQTGRDTAHFVMAEREVHRRLSRILCNEIWDCLNDLEGDEHEGLIGYEFTSLEYHEGRRFYGTYIRGGKMEKLLEMVDDAIHLFMGRRHKYRP